MNPFTGVSRPGRRIGIAVVGGTFLLVGLVMIVTPGPAFVFIPIGLAILAVEFAWAKRWLGRLRRHISAKNSAKRVSRADGHRQRSVGR